MSEDKIRPSRPDAGANVVALMCELVLSLDRGDLPHASRVQGRLDRLGWVVRPVGRGASS